MIVRFGRSPSGERGLKSRVHGAAGGDMRSLPIRGAWIEIFHLIGTTLPILSLPIRGAWIEIGSSTTGTKERDSRSPFGERGLKSVRQGSDRQRGLVAPHPGSVD